MKVALYCRTSTGKQEKGLESQRRALIEYCKSKEIFKYEVFEDFGISGAKSSRPSLNQMMDKVRDGEFCAVIVYSFSRFARSTKHLIDALEKFNTLNVDFISLSEQINTATAIGRMVFTVIAAIGAMEREIISDRVKTGMHNAKMKGKKIGRDRTRPTDAILSLRLKGYTYKEIAKILKVSEGTVGNAIRDGLHRNRTKKP